MLTLQTYRRLIQSPIGALIGPASRKRGTTMPSADFCLPTLCVAVQAAALALSDWASSRPHFTVTPLPFSLLWLSFTLARGLIRHGGSAEEDTPVNSPTVFCRPVRSP